MNADKVVTKGPYHTGVWPAGGNQATKLWKVFDRRISRYAWRKRKLIRATLVKATDIGGASSIKDELKCNKRAKVPHSLFPDGEAFAYRFDTGV